MENKSGIQPVEYKVLVELDSVEEVTEGGIIVPETAKERIQNQQENGTLIATGGSCFENWINNEKAILKPGCRVLINKYAGTGVQGVDRKKYRLVSDRDITAFLKEEK